MSAHGGTSTSLRPDTEAAPALPRYRMNDLLAPTVATAPDSPALISAGTSVTYAELDHAVGLVAGALVGAGVGARDRVAYVGRNSLEQIEVILGAARLNAVAVSVNWRLQADELHYIIDNMEAAVVFVDAEHVGAMLDVVQGLPRVTTVVAVGGEQSIGRAVPFSIWSTDRTAVLEPAEVSEEDTALQIYTSGTTGRPKGVMLPHRAVTTTLPAMADLWKLDADTVMLTVLPWFHIAGLGAVLGALGGGGAAVISNDSDADSLIAAIAEHGVTNLVLASVILQWIVTNPRVTVTDLSTLKVISYGAAPITQATLRAAIDLFGCDLVQVYGLTETMGTVTVLDADDHIIGDGPDRLLSCGRAADGVELRLVDPDTGTDVGVDGVGEVWARSPRNMSGYWRSPAETEAALTSDGWLRTGDLARFDDQAYVYLCDRLKDMIVTGGENVYPTEVENVLQWHPDVAEVTVIGVPDARWGETPKALVVAKAGSAPTAEALIAFSRERLAHFKCPTSVDFVDSLPKTPSGKVLKRSLRAAYWDGLQSRTK